MSSYGVILDIAGCNTALATDARLQPRHAAEVRVALDPAEVPSGMLISHDPDTGELDAGGMTVKIRGNLADLFASIEALGASSTRLDGAINASDSTISLADASAFPSSGRAWIGDETISYTGKSGNDLTGCTRGALSTRARAHVDTARVYAMNPKMLGRQVWLSWQDTFSPSTSTALIRYTGFLDRVQESSDGVSLQLVSAQARLRDQAVFTGSPWFKGRLARPLGTARDSIKVQLDDKANPPSDNRDTRYGRGYVRIDDEVIEVGSWRYPQVTIPITAQVNETLIELATIPGDLEVGDQVDLCDSTGNVKATVTILALDLANLEATVGASEYSHASGDQLSMNYHALAYPNWTKRGIVPTEPAAHEVGAEVTEIRILEGDSIAEILLPCLLSVGGTGTSAFDVLPMGWGLSLPSDFVDIDAWLAVVAAGRSQPRQYVCDSDLSIVDLLQWISITHNLSVFWDETGKLTCSLVEDIYPDTKVDHVLDESRRHRNEGYALDSSMDRLRTVATVAMDKGIDGDPRSRLIVENADAIDLFGKREIEISDAGLRSASAEVALFQILRGYLRQRSFEASYVTYKTRLDPSRVYLPGDLCSLILPNVFNHRGGRGISAIYQIVRVAPADASGYIELELLYRDTPDRLGLIAPCALIEEANGDEITLAASSASLYGSGLARSELVPELESGTDGMEDRDFFLTGDRITIWQESSFGSGSVVSENHTVTGGDTSSRTLALAASVAGWVGAGDLVRLSNWTVFAGASTVAKRAGVFLALADGTVVPAVLGASDEPYFWGD